MVDYLTLALTHGLMALALWRMQSRRDLDHDGAQPAKPRQPWRRAAPRRSGDGA